MAKKTIKVETVEKKTPKKATSKKVTTKSTKREAPKPKVEKDISIKDEKKIVKKKTAVKKETKKTTAKEPKITKGILKKGVDIVMQDSDGNKVVIEKTCATPQFMDIMNKIAEGRLNEIEKNNALADEVEVWVPPVEQPAPHSGFVTKSDEKKRKLFDVKEMMKIAKDE